MQDLEQVALRSRREDASAPDAERIFCLSCSKNALPSLGLPAFACSKPMSISCRSLPSLRSVAGSSRCSQAEPDSHALVGTRHESGLRSQLRRLAISVVTARGGLGDVLSHR
jgi:hypothetical protein